ncbi:MAG TPA: hypothetical protein VKU41_06390 [Polyangiaceae bacterium]|nr:hypothetical protein [Polyangiaceae bacterium]
MTRRPRGTAALAWTVLATFAPVACRSSAAPTPAVSIPSSARTDGGASTALPPPAVAGQGESRESASTRKMLARVEVVRGLRAQTDVPGVILRRTALIARVRDHLERELPAEAIRNEGLGLQLLGFIPTAYDYEAAEYDLLEDQLAGYYEPADGTMYMADDLPAEETDATLAHELVHALQDQYWNLKDRSKYRPGEGDGSEASSALAEGDATSAMFDVMFEEEAPGRGVRAPDVPDATFVQRIREGMNQGPVSKAPRFMRSSLVAPYVYGTLFVHALRRHGGWPAVNKAWHDPPTTTEQILHLDKWLSHEAALAVGAPPYRSLGAGWSVADEDSEGELGTRLAFEEWMDQEAAAETARGWGGDREVLLYSGDRHAFAWRLRFDPTPANAGAVRAFAAVSRGLATATEKPERSFFCRERSDRGPIGVARSGDDLVFVVGPARVDGTGWSSAGNCNLARAWAREITGRSNPN